jgi:hypothetical protein
MTKRFILRDEEVKQRALLLLLDLPVGEGEPLFEVVLRQYHKDRSLEQNARLWAMHQAASKETGTPAPELHMLMCSAFLGWKEYDGVGEKIRAPITTTSGPEGKKLTVKEMAKFISEVEEFYVSRGINIDKVHGESLYGDEEETTTN